MSDAFEITVSKLATGNFHIKQTGDNTIKARTSTDSRGVSLGFEPANEHTLAIQVEANEEFTVKFGDILDMVNGRGEPITRETKTAEFKLDLNPDTRYVIEFQRDDYPDGDEVFDADIAVELLDSEKSVEYEVFRTN